ncbi:MAG: AMP-binding protein, partial [Myxococcales bacterium]|nr:AMP-binding protein [Myxococcales bacterium]
MPVTPRSCRSLVQLLQHRARDTPQALYYRILQTGDVDGPTVEATWADADRSARRIAAHLQELGLAGERALLLYPPGDAFIAAFYGCLYAGVIAVPAYPPDPTRLARTLPRLRRIAEDADVAVVLAPEVICLMAQALAKTEPRLSALRWVASDAVAAGLEDQWTAPAVDQDSVALLQYTSGSTGDPKGVIVTHGNLLHNSSLIRRGFAHPERAVGLIWLPHIHDMGLVGGVIQPVYANLEVTFMSPLDFLRRPLRWLEAITATGAHTSGGPDFAYRLCLRKIADAELDRLDLSSWRVAFTGAEPVRADTLAAFADRFARCGFDRRAFYPTYGLAEATLLVSGNVGAPRPPIDLRVDADALAGGRVRASDAVDRSRALVSCGPVAADYEVAIVDPETRRRCPADAIGEIWLRGPSVAGGYWERPEESAATFNATLEGGAGGFLRTGDLGFLRGDELFVVGRLKDLLIIRGRNVYPQDIEAAAQEAHPHVRAGCVAAFGVDVGGEERAVVVAEVDPRGAPLDAEAILQAVRARVAEELELELHVVSLLARGGLPKTSSGKIQRRATGAAWTSGELEELARAEAPALPRYAGPSEAAPADADGAIDTLRRLLAAHLGVAPEHIDPRAPLRSYGLDSLALVELTGQIEELFRRPLETLTLFSFPTIEALAG